MCGSWNNNKLFGFCRNCLFCVCPRGNVLPFGDVSFASEFHLNVGLAFGGSHCRQLFTSEMKTIKSLSVFALYILVSLFQIRYCSFDIPIRSNELAHPFPIVLLNSLFGWNPDKPRGKRRCPAEWAQPDRQGYSIQTSKYLPVARSAQGSHIQISCRSILSLRSEDNNHFIRTLIYCTFSSVAYSAISSNIIVFVLKTNQKHFCTM